MQLVEATLQIFGLYIYIWGLGCLRRMHQHVLTSCLAATPDCRHRCARQRGRPRCHAADAGASAGAERRAASADVGCPVAYAACIRVNDSVQSGAMWSCLLAVRRCADQGGSRCL